MVADLLGATCPFVAGGLALAIFFALWDRKITSMEKTRKKASRTRINEHT